jgi:dipeptidyl aminopeptidase/acylaminoacyl peptidase
MGAFHLTGAMKGAAYHGKWQFAGLSGTFRLDEAAAPPPPYREENVTFIGAHGTKLSGVLILPLARGPHPGFVGVHGSGAETRAGANRYYSELIVQEGAAVLLFDKRGTGKSEGDWRSASLEDLAGDVDAALSVLTLRKDIDRRRLGLLGASQAGWVSALVAAKRPCLSYLMMRSAVLTPVWYEAQDDHLVRLRGEPEEVISRARRILDLDQQVTRTGIGHQELQTELATVAGEAWFSKMKFELVPPDAPSRKNFRSWIDFNPMPSLKKSRASALWIYGGQDSTIPAARSADIARSLSDSERKYEVATFPTLSHALHTPPPQGSPWPRVSPEVLRRTSDWYRRHVAQGQRPVQKSRC